MGCINEHYLNDYTLLGVWKIEEDLDALMSFVELDNEDLNKFKQFRSNSRKKEFLSVRALLAELLGPDPRIVYNKNNKPFLKDGSHFISISHSNKLTAIMLSTREKVGIDLEYMSSNISAIAFKFINKKEKITRDRQNKRYHLYLHWCAKEALYKVCDKEGINIKKNITIYPFDLSDTGEIKGKVHSERINEIFDLHYSRYDNYAIVWTKKEYNDKRTERDKKYSPVAGSR
jgi:phosphopantetheinyl transferase